MKKKNKRSKEVPEDKTKMTESAKRLSLEDSPTDEDISGSREPVPPTKPDMLREDHPDLAK